MKDHKGIVIDSKYIKATHNVEVTISIGLSIDSVEDKIEQISAINNLLNNRVRIGLIDKEIAKSETNIEPQEIEMLVQYRGKTITKMEFPKNMSKDKMAELAHSNEEVNKILKSGTFKAVVVPGRLINIFPVASL